MTTGIAKGLLQGRNEGAYDKAIKTAAAFLKMGKNSLEDISICTGLSLDEVQRVKDNNL